MLLNEIQNDKQIRGIRIRNHQFKYRAFADDVAFFLEDPNINISNLLDKIEEYGQIAGFKINKSKSKLLLKNIKKNESIQIQEISKCEVTQKAKYLGVYLTGKNVDLFKNNYEKVWKEIKSDLEKWNQQYLSLLGRISLIKMNVLPRILFLFQTLPIAIKGDHFKKWKKIITEFIWAGRRSRIKNKILCDAREGAYSYRT